MNTIKYTAAVSVDKGLIRNNNEDNFYFNGVMLNADDRDNSNTFTASPSENVQIYGVFDGMGGEAMGEEASLIAAQILGNTHKKILSGDLDYKKEILSAINTANTKICKKIIDSGEKRIGATFSALVIDNDKAKIFNVGDSRVYLLRDGVLKQISEDDTTAQRMVNMGVLSSDAAKTHKDRHKLTQHLGIFKDEMTIEPHVSQSIEIKKDDVFLMCSDGLTDMLADDEICAILNCGKSCKEICEKLVKKALNSGGKDNVTTLVVRAETNKKKRKKADKLFLPLTLLICCVVAFSIYAVNKNIEKSPSNKEETENVDVANIYFSNPVNEVKVGSENTFMIGVEPANANGKVEFVSLNSDIIAIDKDTGYYKAISSGTATIKASVGSVSCLLGIEVYEPIEDIENIPKTLKINIGDIEQLQYKVIPETESSKISFTSENENVASVSETGKILGNKVGKTNIVVSVRDYSETIEISVVQNINNISSGESSPKKDSTTNKGNETSKNEKPAEKSIEKSAEPQTHHPDQPVEPKPETKTEGNNSGTGREIISDDTANAQ